MVTIVLLKKKIYFLRINDGIDVLFIMDITKNGEKATQGFWEFTVLEKQMEDGTLQLLRFNLLDIQVTDIRNPYLDFHMHLIL